MKPNFALDLSQDGIRLLHRARRGWTLIGEVPLDAPDMAEQLRILRETALSLDPSGLRSKLVIPDSEILYTNLPVNTDTPEGAHSALRSQLEGLTPYPVEQLAFDWVGHGAQVPVAVVAHDTLAEAETFATEHRLNPVSFVANPQNGPEGHEPFFGLTKAAAQLLDADDPLERDTQPIGTTASALVVEETTPPNASAALPEAAFAEELPHSPSEISEDATGPDTLAHDRLPEPQENSGNTALETSPEETAEDTHAETDQAAITSTESASPEAPSIEAKAEEAPILPKPPQGAEPTTAPEHEEPQETPAPSPPIGAALSKAEANSPTEPPAQHSIPAETHPLPTETPPVSPFGIAQPTPPGLLARPAIIGGAMTALLALAALAIWVLLSQDTRHQNAEIPPQPGETIVPAPKTASSSPVQTAQTHRPIPLPPGAVGAPRIPAPPSTIAWDDIAQAPNHQLWPELRLPTPAPQEHVMLTPRPAEKTSQDILAEEDQSTASAINDATAPQTSPSPEVVVTPPPQEAPKADTVAADVPSETDALPAEVDTQDTSATDSAVLAALADDPLAGLRPRARNAATPIVETADQDPTAEAPETSDTPEEPPEAERNLGGLNYATLSAQRPRARAPLAVPAPPPPAPEAGPGGDAATAASLAALAQLTPKARPRNLPKPSRTAPDKSDDNAPVAKAVPRTAAVRPSAPTVKSVARQATVQKAINLRKVNLIGVYGTSNSRRALVRLKSGRFVKLKIGDKLDGGRVAAIGERELRYVKRGRNYTLQLPKG